MSELSCPLTQCEKGKTFLVSTISGDRSTRAKINSLGFTPGTKIHVCDNCQQGLKKVIVRDSSFIIDESFASVIMCKPCEFDPKSDAVCML